jgi:HNH endonuclease
MQTLNATAEEVTLGPRIDFGGGPEACWPWLGTKQMDGRGIIKHKGRNYLVPRLVWAKSYGDPGAMNVCHRCDNPTCANPSHLFLGTQADNLRDAREKGRAVFWNNPRLSRKRGKR